ncbi:hypothetical protein Avbf_00842, partial [Armadillidium vulgare]
QLICDVCRKFIQKDPNKYLSALPVEEALKDNYGLTTSSTSSASSSFVEEELINVENIRFKWSDPSKECTFGNKTKKKKKKKEEEKLKAVLTTVKMQLEDSYDVTLSIQEEDLSLDNSKIKKVFTLFPINNIKMIVEIK